ncbi:unnamed protein product, partial [Rotaria sp. Silwood2]
PKRHSLSPLPQLPHRKSQP